MMKNRKILIILGIACLTLALFPQVRAEEAPPAIPVGEHLVYKITWLRIPIGIGEVWAKEKTTLNGREVYHIVGKIETNKVLSKIFPMHDEAHSWIDAETLESVQFEKKVDELRTHAHERLIFDRQAKKGRYESFITGERYEFPVTVPVHDVFSAMYWARRQKAVPGTPLKTVLCADQKDWALTIHIIGEQTIKRNGNKIKVLRVDPDTVVEGEEKRGRARFYVTNDASHTPLKIVFKATFGSVVGTLIGSGSEISYQAPDETGTS